MYTHVTWQDYQGATEPRALIVRAIDRYKLSPYIRRALDAASYFRGENTAVSRKTILRAR